jgi:hypothetical protein
MSFAESISKAASAGMSLERRSQTPGAHVPGSPAPYDFLTTNERGTSLKIAGRVDRFLGSRFTGTSHLSSSSRNADR